MDLRPQHIPECGYLALREHWQADLYNYIILQAKDTACRWKGLSIVDLTSACGL